MLLALVTLALPRTDLERDERLLLQAHTHTLAKAVKHAKAEIRAEWDAPSKAGAATVATLSAVAAFRRGSRAARASRAAQRARWAAAGAADGVVETAHAREARGVRDRGPVLSAADALGLPAPSNSVDFAARVVREPKFSWN